MKSILITGAAKNSGFGMARKFASKGWAVFITSRREADAAKAAGKIREEFKTPCFGVEYEVGNTDAVYPVLERIRAEGYVLDSLILNAANLGLNTDPLTVDIKDWASVIQTNVIGHFQCARTFAKEMIEHGVKGTIVFVGSIMYRNCFPSRSSYSASKGAVLSLSKALAVEFGRYGIRVNCLMPGPIHTDRYDALDEETRLMRNRELPIGRVSTADDIAGGAYFLASDDSGNATGTGLVIDGGMDCMYAGRY